MNEHSTLGNVLVAGLGKSGLAAVLYLLERKELFSTLTICDANETPARAGELENAAQGVEVKTLYGIEELPDSSAYDVAIVSPGIAPVGDLYKSIEAHCTRVISEIEFAFECHPQNWIAITGTNGKTTTTSLTTHLLVEAGLNAVSVGNIGSPAIEAVGKASADTIFVAEVSSFQLHAIDAFKPSVAALLNITPDHINWHGSMEAYAQDKARVFENCGQGDTILMNGDDEASEPFIVRAQALGATTKVISLNDNEIVRWIDPSRLQIKGPHNISNALFAIYAAKAYGVSDEDISRALATFSPVEHRLQFVAAVEGIAWYNDSKATNPDAVFKALSAFEKDPIILLLGGRNKGNRFLDLARAAFAKPNFKYALCFGEAGQVIFDDFRAVEKELFGDTRSTKTILLPTMNDAMEKARALGESGDCIVLSPACASFDEFNSFEHRGEVFMDKVHSYLGDK